MNVWFMLATALCVGLALGYMLPEPVPYLDVNKKGAKVLVLACIDPRFTERLAHHLTHNKAVHADYDLFALAGASLGVLQHDYPSWRTAFFDHVGLAIALHDIKEIWAFDHLDCGMYKATLGLKDDLDPAIHSQHLLELRDLLNRKHPQIGFRGFVMMTDGSIVAA